MANDSPKMLTAAEVAKLFQVSDQLIYNLVKARKITHVRFGSMIRFWPADIEDYIQANLSEVKAEPVGQVVQRLPTPKDKG